MLVVILFAISILASVWIYFIYVSAMPNGEWDAYAIWNLHARFLFREPALWKNMFNSALELSHPDYPLLLPASIARSWQYIGTDALFAGQAMSFLFVFAMMAVTISTVMSLKGNTQGLLCGLALMSATFLVQHASMQYADMPLAFFFVSAVAAYLLYCRFGCNGRPLVFAGMMASFAAWTKNEGMVFFVIFAVLLFIFEEKKRIRDPSRSYFKYFIAGALPAIITLVYFKTFYYFRNDIFSSVFSDTPGVLSRLLTPERYFVSISALFDYSYFGGYIGKFGLFMYLAIAGISVTAAAKRGLLFTLLLYLAMVAVYFMIFIIFPVDLNWLATCSMNRVLAQLFPIFIMMVFLVARPADDILSGDGN
jgi:hypothetical protein